MALPEIWLVPLAGRRWRVQQDFIVGQTVADGYVIVPKGFVCDLNSIPRMLWWASTPADYPEAGVVHDFLYHSQIGQAKADSVYLEMLLASGMDSFRAKSRYRMLRIFGGVAYTKHRKAIVHAPAPPLGTLHTEKLPNIITGATEGVPPPKGNTLS